MGNSVVTQGNGVRAHGTMPTDGATAPGTLPPDVRRLLIVGAGGFGREVIHWATAAWPEASAMVAGFLSADADRHGQRTSPLPILGDPAAYQPASGDAFILAIGIPNVRRAVSEGLLARGANFLTLIHPTAIVAPTARIGIGSVLCPYSIVSDATTIGRFVLINCHASLGHDASAGDYSVLSPYATLGGNAHVEPDVFMGMHASVSPGKRVGARSKVSANSCASHDAPADSLVFGVPCRIRHYVATAQAAASAEIPA